MIASKYRHILMTGLFFTLVVLSFGALKNKGYAYDVHCADGASTTIASNLGTEDRQAAAESFCKGKGGIRSASAGASTACDTHKSFLGFPTWYKYLKGRPEFDEALSRSTCQPVIEGINDIWKIVAAVIDLLLRVAVLVAIGFIVFGGVLYTISQGQPDKTKEALRTIINAVVGLAIAIVATALVSFVAGRFN